MKRIVSILSLLAVTTVLCVCGCDEQTDNATNCWGKIVSDNGSQPQKLAVIDMARYIGQVTEKCRR